MIPQEHVRTGELADDEFRSRTVLQGPHPGRRAVRELVDAR
jgi:hypothetical protein